MADKINLADPETVDRLYADLDPTALFLLAVADDAVNSFVLEDFRDEAEGRCMSVSVFPCNRILLTADDRANLLAWKEDAQPDRVLCYSQVLIKLFMLEPEGRSEIDARAESVALVRNTMTRLLELLDAGIPVEGWTMFANFSVRAMAGAHDNMQFSTAIARTYYRSILQQLDQSEASCVKS